MGSNFAAAPATHNNQLPTIVSFKFFIRERAVMVWDCTGLAECSQAMQNQDLRIGISPLRKLPICHLHPEWD